MRPLRDPDADADADATTPASPEHTVTATEQGDGDGDDGSGLRVKVGDVVGRHFLVAELGRGGMGRVFAAHDGGLDRTVAIKFITVVNEAMIERFLAEARVTARCTHPNIVGVHEIGRHQGLPYLVLEHLAGPSLSRLVRGERLPLPRVVAIMTAVARALGCAHSHGIVHRDLTPSNIVVLPDGTVKVLDFGIAAYATTSSDGELAAARRPREVAGTLRYMAPEQILGGDLDGRADLWAFGVVLHELLAGVRPFDHLDDTALRAQLADLEQPTPSIERHRADLPAALVAVVARCLEKVRARRYRSANELVVALQRLAGDQAACELPLWLTSAPSADEGDRVALGLVQALAARGTPAGIDVRATRVWPDGRAELAAGTEASTAAADVRAVALLARDAIDAAGGVRTPRERRRAARMRHVLAPVVRDRAPRSPSARRLARRLAAAHTPRRTAAALAIGALVALALVVAFALPAFRAPPRAAPAATAPQLERLESAMARLVAAGDDDAARVLFDRFVAQPENAGLRAEAWLHRSEREQAAHALDPALASAAAAYLAALDEDGATRALAAIAQLQRARRRWNELGHALAALGPSDDPAIARAAAELAFAMRRPVAPDPAVPAEVLTAAHLLSGQPAATAPTSAAAVDLDGDGRDELLAIQGGILSAARADGTTLWMRPAGSARVLCVGRDTGGAWFALVRGGPTRLFRADASGASVVLRAGRAAWCALGDLDGDRAAELYIAGDRELVRFHAEPGGAWRPTPIAIGSVVNGLTAADLDGDGDDELAIAAGEWQAYDVRVLGGAALALVDRVRLGRVSALAALADGPGQPHVLLARKDSEWPSVLFLPPDRPTGAANGYYTLRLDGGRLRVASHLAERLVSMDGDIHPADLDGDGRDEALATEVNAGARHSTWVIRRGEREQLSFVVIEDVSILATGRFGGGPAAAALAAIRLDPRTPATWWLGLGTTPVPPLAAPPGAERAPPAAAATPATLEPALAVTWRRAALLGRVGESASALAAFEQLAAVMPPELQSHALAEVLALRRHRGESLGAIHESLAERAAPGSAAQVAALTAAATAAADDGELADAVRVIDAALTAPTLDAAERARLEASRARVEAVATVLFDGGPLDDHWQILDPTAVRRDQVTRTLVIDSFGRASLAAMELTRGRGPIQLTIEGTVTRAEWAAGVRFGLRPLVDGAPPLAFVVRSSGGGGVYRLIAEFAQMGLALVPHDDVVGRIPLRMRVTYFPETERATWDIMAGAARLRRVTRFARPTATRWRLEVDSDYSAGVDGGTRMAVALDRVTVAGLEPAPLLPRSPLVLARLALANGELERARTLVARATGPDAALVAALRALRAGDHGAGVAALIRMRGRGPLTAEPLRRFAHLARVDDGLHASAVRTAVASDRIAITAFAWMSVARQHPRAEAVQRELTQNLRDLDLRGAAASVEASELLLLRARARAAIGDLAAAADDLDVLLARAPPGARRAEAYLERARVAVRRGATDDAVGAIQAALDASPWPEAIADLVLLDPATAALATRPGLERVLALGRPLAAP